MTDIKTGDTFGYLKVVKEGEITKTHQRRFWCVCHCGKSRLVQRCNLLSGCSRSCGCMTNVKHGKRHTRTYSIWAAMKNRCNNKDNRDYGAKGIKVCVRWRLSFETFLKDMGEAPDGKTIDRIDTTGNYEPSNCRWATPKEQSNNRSSNVNLTYQGETLTQQQWSERLGISRVTIRRRLLRGWSVHKTLSTKGRSKG